MILQCSGLSRLASYKLSLTLSNKYGKKTCYSTSFFSTRRILPFGCISRFVAAHMFGQDLKTLKKKKNNPLKY